jgi:hypothetical protein
VQLQIRIVGLFRNAAASKLISEVAKQDAVLAQLIQERKLLTAEGRNYDAVARKLDEARANKTKVSQPLIDLVASCDALSDNRNRLLEFIAGDVTALNARRKLQETVVHRYVMDRFCIGNEHACIILPDSTIRCWGRCTEGQCSPPEDASVLYRQISCSDYATCAVDNDDFVRCWGSGLFGIATPPSEPLSHISMGSGHVCGISRQNKRVVCWGWNDLGQTDVPFNLTATSVASSRYHSCALDVNTGVVCWGANRNNAAQPPLFLSSEGRSSGSLSDIASNLTDVATSLYHSCVLGVQVNFLACWGADGMNDGRATVPPPPLTSIPLLCIKTLSCAGTHWHFAHFGVDREISHVHNEFQQRGAVLRRQCRLRFGAKIEICGHGFNAECDVWYPAGQVGRGE